MADLEKPWPEVHFTVRLTLRGEAIPTFTEDKLGEIAEGIQEAIYDYFLCNKDDEDTDVIVQIKREENV
jgi:hypothetical protein